MIHNRKIEAATSKEIFNTKQPQLIKFETESPEKRETPDRQNKPENILSAWSALEILSPPTFDKPEKLSGGDKRSIVDIGHDTMPWENGSKHERKNYKLYYHIILGTINMEKSVTDLMQIYADKRAEKPLAKGQAILASIIVDKEGRPVQDPPITIASFGWGLSRALQGYLKDLGNWSLVEKSLIKDLKEILLQTDEERDIAPLNLETLQQAYEWLIESLELPSHLVQTPKFAIRTYEYYKNPDPPEPLILNSFFLNDLEAARLAFQTGTESPNLKRYLGVTKPKKRYDLLKDSKALEKSIAPKRFPLSCWPGHGHHPLVLLQQAGVNLATYNLQDEGILAINGPPGTGKTTLLRDVIAEIITKRANAMSLFSNPADAFKHSGKKIKVGNGWLHLYQIDQGLRGYEILIASSNNKAVENVSAELPGIGAIADDVDLRYFKTVSDALTSKESWGLIAGVLGNSKNRYDFKQTFWWNKDFGLATYLAEAAGIPQFFEENDKTIRKPRVIKNENPPSSTDDALARWKIAQRHFRRAVQQSEENLEKLESIRQIALALETLQNTEDKLVSRLKSHSTKQKEIESKIYEIKNQQIKFQKQINRAEDALKLWQKEYPGVFSWLLKKTDYKIWEAQKLEKKSDLSDLKQKYQKTIIPPKKKAYIALNEVQRNIAEQGRKLDEIRLKIKNHEQEINTYKELLGLALIDQSFALRSHEEKQGLAPWLDAMTHRLREAVFIEAMKLHKAFIDGAAKPLRHNLGALMNVWGGKSLPENNDLLPDLWTSLFLVVPSLSTTFASVEGMIGTLPPETLGWLLVDEAGQALPQACVGAIMRSKRAVVVGDPIQIEPVVMLPDSLTESICRQFDIDPNYYNAPAASVQTLSDEATPYMTKFTGRKASRTVGVPLLVHRRCREPMFSISNAIAYEHLMINKKADKPSKIEDCLGRSTWFDIKGSVREKWCPEEGQKVLELLEKLKKNRLAPDLYIITPFVIVQDNLRRVIRESHILDNWIDNPKWIYKRIGTVHTVQGREAEAVIFVLGAPGLEQRGARSWAGGRPNLLNVAVTRAKESIYVVGNRDLWKNFGTFKELDHILPS